MRDSFIKTLNGLQPKREFSYQENMVYIEHCKIISEDIINSCPKPERNYRNRVTQLKAEWRQRLPLAQYVRALYSVHLMVLPFLRFEFELIYTCFKYMRDAPRFRDKLALMIISFGILIYTPLAICLDIVFFIPMLFCDPRNIKKKS